MTYRLCWVEQWSTCTHAFDGIAYNKGCIRDIIEKKLLQISHHVSNSLAMLHKVSGMKKLTTSLESDEVFPEYGKMWKGFPSWVSCKDRKLLRAKVNETKFDLIVAKDGIGNSTTIGKHCLWLPTPGLVAQQNTLFHTNAIDYNLH